MLPHFPRLHKIKNPIPKKWRRAFAVVAVLAIIAGGPGAYLLLRHPAPAEAAWFNYNWGYRQVMTITNGSGSIQTNFQVKMTVSTSTLVSAGKMQSNCADIRITDNTGKVLPYWIETGTNACNTTTTAIWVKVPNIPTTASKIYLYYGSPSAQASQNGKQTFDFFDDFSESALDGSIWNNSGGTATIKAGELLITTGAIYTKNPILTSNQNELVEMRVKWATTQVNYAGMVLGDVNTIAAGNAATAKMSALATNGATIPNTAFAGDGTSATYNVVSIVNQFTPTANTYTFSGMGYDATSSATLHYYGNRVQTGAYTDTASFSPFLTLGYFPGSTAAAADITDMTVDFVLGRKYASTEPTLSAASEEVGAAAVGYWKFNEGSGQVVNDSSKTQNSGTLGANSSVASDDPTWTSDDLCVSSKCLKFDGSNDIVKIPANAAINPTESGAFTISGWFKTNAVGATQALINKQENTTNELVFGLTLNSSNQVTFNVIKQNVSGNSATSTQSLNTNQWYYLTGTYDGSNITLYVNGVLAAATTRSFSSSTQNVANITVGSYYNSTSYFNGFAGEIKYYPYARTAAQITTDMVTGQSVIGNSAQEGAALQQVLSNGLLDYYKMDEASWTVNCSTGSVLDSSGNGNNGKSCPTSTGPAGGDLGKFGNAGTFDGSNDYVSAAAGSFSPYVGSVSMWLTNTQDWNTLSAIQSPFSTAQDGSGDLMNIELTNTSEIKIQFWDGYSANFRSASPTTWPTANTWHHLVVTWNGSVDKPSNTQIYLDGVPLTMTSDVTIPTDAIGATLNIGGNNPIGDRYPWSGKIDEVRVYSRALTPSEVTQVYNFAPGPVAQYNLEESTGTTTNDTSGSNLPATLVNGPTWGVGKYGGGINFDGTNDYLSVADNTIIEPPNDMTLNLFVYQNLTATAQGHDVVYARKIHPSSPFQSYQVYQQSSDNKVCFLWYNSTPTGYTVCSNTALTNNTWYYLTAIKSGTSMYLYINGIDKSAGTVTATGSMYNSSGLLVFGDDSGANKAMNGTIDQITLYNYARSNKQIVEDMNAGHPVGGSPLGSQAIYWKLDELNSTTINNSGNGGPTYNGTASSASWLTNVICKVNGCLNFSSNSGVVNGGSPTIFDGLNTMTLSLWINPQTLTNNNSIISKFNGSSNAFQVRTTSTAGQLRIIISNAATDSSNYCLTSGQTLDTGYWQHIAIVYDGTAAASDRIKAYKNGVPFTCTMVGTIPTTILTSTANFTIGANSAGGGGAIGYYDEAKVYTAALTQDQVNIDYNQGKAVNYGIGTGIEANQLTDTAGNPPIGYWPMDDHTGASIVDTSGNGNTGTITAATFKPGKIGTALNFDGVSATVAVANESNFDFERTDSFTNSFWINPNVTRSGATNTYKVIAKRETTGANQGWEIMLNWDGTSQTHIRMNLLGNTGSGLYVQTSGTTDIPNNVWTHIETVYTGTSTAAGIKFYVNGVLETNTVQLDALGTNTILNNVPLQFGSLNGTSQYYPGALDDVKVYNYVRTPAQVAYDYNRGGPMGFWKFNECQGAVANDSSGNGFSGAISIGGSGTYTSTGTCGSGTSTEAWNAGTVGKINSALGFDGTNDTVNLGNNFNFSATQPFSASAWIKTTVNSGMTILSKQDSNSPYSGWNLQTGGGGYMYFQLVNSYCSAGNCLEVSYAADSHYYDGNWHLITSTYDGSGSGAGVALYIDGRKLSPLSGTGGTITSSPTNSISAQIGSRNNAQQFFNGLIDQPRIYNYSLSAAQVQRLYNQDFTAFYGPATGSP